MKLSFCSLSQIGMKKILNLSSTQTSEKLQFYLRKGMKRIFHLVNGSFATNNTFMIITDAFVFIQTYEKLSIAIKC